MNERRAVVAGIRELQAADQQWRTEHPELALPGALLDVITSCGFQYYAEHDVTDDLRFLDRAGELLKHAPSLVAPYWTSAATCIRRLAHEAEPLRADTGDLDAREALRRVLVEVPPDVLLGRRDEEASPVLVCRNEAIGLADGISTPYRCASRISALAYFSAPDRYGVIDEMVALRERYETSATERVELAESIRAGVRRYLEWSQAGT
ncbi:hypothetical protein ACFPK1_02080 [Actinomycetospora rhizophila]|uniref:Uncharacterized protein n=1 Tax=Actinomycetospora rhizophila TaxID=1416876 RepID=A0ABV9Z658_9PSEU